MHNKFEQDTRKSYYAHKVKLMMYNAVNQSFWFFPAIIQLVWELVISNMQNKFEQDTLKAHK